MTTRSKVHKHIHGHKVKGHKGTLMATRSKVHPHPCHKVNIYGHRSKISQDQGRPQRYTSDHKVKGHKGTLLATRSKVHLWSQGQRYRLKYKDQSQGSGYMVHKIHGRKVKNSIYNCKVKGTRLFMATRSKVHSEEVWYKVPHGQKRCDHKTRRWLQGQWYNQRRCVRTGVHSWPQVL